VPQLARTTTLRRAAVQAVRAPSVHNTQPWRLRLTPDSLEVHADWSRRLSVLDGHGRQVLMSCGCALLNARVAIAAAGRTCRVERVPDPAHPDLLARVVLLDEPPAGSAPSTDTLARLDAAVGARRTTRTPFTGDPPPAGLLVSLVGAAADEGAELAVLDVSQGRTATRLSRRADEVQDAVPGYRLELAAWTGGDVGRTDGVPVSALPPRTGRGPDTRGMGLLTGQDDPTTGALMVLGTRHESQLEWLRAGEALERVLLELTAAGFAASTLMQVIEVAETSVALRAGLGLVMHPQALLRVGRAAEVPATRRRRLVDVLSETA
jgi:hypothetical protein